MKIFNLLVAVSMLALFSCGGGESTEDALRKLDSLNKSLDESMNTDASAGKYTSEDGKFKINFPGTPTVTSEAIPTEVGNIDMKMFTYEKSATEVYMVAYSDYPSALVEASDAATLLEGAKSGAVSSQGAVIEEENAITVDGNPGILFKAKAGSYYMYYKIFLVSNRLFQLVILRDGNYPEPEAVESYIDSFELIK